MLLGLPIAGTLCLFAAAAPADRPPWESLYRNPAASVMEDRAEHARPLRPLGERKREIAQARQDRVLEFFAHFAAASSAADLNGDGELDALDWHRLAFLGDPEPPLPNPGGASWNANRGEWAFEGAGAEGTHFLNAAAVADQPLPTAFELDVEFTLDAGRSAGALFWADPSGESGFAVRYDAVHGLMMLSRLGPWPEEERLDWMPFQIAPGQPVRLTVRTAEYGIQVFDPEQFRYPILEAAAVTPLGDRWGYWIEDATARFDTLAVRRNFEPVPPRHRPVAGGFSHIHDPGVGEAEPWYINDHCFAQGPDGVWHLFGIANTANPIRPQDEDQFAHATAERLTQSPWTKQPFALRTDESAGESVLWAPHVVLRDGLYHMFYTAGSQFSSYEFRTHLATSPDLKNWTRHPANPLFKDYYDARDSMVLPLDGQYQMYHTATLDRPVGNHIVARRSGVDLIEWSHREPAFIHEKTGTFGGPTESPFVVRHGGYFYLLTGPEALGADPLEDYRRTAVFRSADPYFWAQAHRAGTIQAHAPEVVRDGDGNWFVSHAGWFFNGVFLAPLAWEPEPEVRVFVNLGESLDYVTRSEGAFVSDWRNTGGLDLVADFGGFFEMAFAVPSGVESLRVELEEEGELKLERVAAAGTLVLADEGDSGPGFASIHSFEVPAPEPEAGELRLRFSDADPSDGWGPNVNWIRLLWP